MLIGRFKTAYLQREVYLDAKVTADLPVNALVTVTAGDIPTVAAASDLASATHILAQSDMTATPYDGAMPTNLGRYDAWNYQYIRKNEEEEEWKHVAFYKILDPDDIQVQDIGDWEAPKN